MRASTCRPYRSVSAYAFSVESPWALREIFVLGSCTRPQGIVYYGCALRTEANRLLTFGSTGLVLPA